MALKTILLRKKLGEKQKAESELRAKAAANQKREEELAAAVEEAETEEEIAAVEEAVTELETATVKEQLETIAGEIADLLSQIEESEAAQAEAVQEVTGEEPAEDENNGEERSRRRGARSMNRMDTRAAAEFQRTGKHTYKDVRSLIRAAVVSNSTGVIGPTGVAGITDPVAPVSSMIDLVKLVDATGMAQYKVAALTADATDAAITEGSVPTESEPTFAAVTFTPAN